MRPGQSSSAMVRDGSDVRPLRYRLDVIASSVAEAVHGVGGWMCDHAGQGWDVNVLVPAADAVQPLKILGAGLDNWDSLLRADRPAQRPRILAVSQDILAHQPQLRRRIRGLTRLFSTELVLRGPSENAAVCSRYTRVGYQPSQLACALKGHALAAADLTGPVNPTETLRITAPRAVRDRHGR